jgi:hypothetical protein
MRVWQALVAVFIASGVPSTAEAIIRPSFSLDSCTWEASHIVVVTEGDKIDGVIEVLECWKGDLNKGDRLNVPELAEFAPKDKRKVSPRLLADDKTGLPTHVTCQRMVLFLVKKQAPDQPAKVVWGPVGMWKQMKVSAAWIEKGRVFAFAQQINPGPSLLIPWDMAERAFRSRIREIVKTRTALDDAVVLNDPEKVSAAVSALVKSAPEFTHEMILALRDAGPKALPTLRKMLRDDSLGWHQSFVPEAMAKAAGASVGAELTDVLKQELAFWKKTGPSLKKGWWNGVGLKWENVDPLRNRYGKALGMVRALQETRFAPCRETVIAFRDHWRSLPQLREVDQMEQACDEVLKALR